MQGMRRSCSEYSARRLGSRKDVDERFLSMELILLLVL